MSCISYQIGDATRPEHAGNKIIVHCCNNIGRWGRGFVVALSQRWPEPEDAYKAWYRQRSRNDFGLGAVQFVQVEADVWVANLIGQDNIATQKGCPPVSYSALEDGLATVAAKAKELDASLHMPRIGCGLAGGAWPEVESIISQTLCSHDLAVCVYDLS